MSEQLKEYFSKFGRVKQASVVFDQKTGFSRQYGFVEYTNKSGYDAAVNHDVHVIENKQVNLSAAMGRRQNTDNPIDDTDDN